MIEHVEVEYTGGGPADGKTARVELSSLTMGAPFFWTENGITWTYEAVLEDEPTRCVFRFKDEWCGYRGTETACDLTFKRCEVLGNARRFGGWHGMPGEVRQRWVLRLKRPGKAKA